MEVAVFLLLLSSSIHFASSTTSSTFLGNDTDMISLLAFKSLITRDPSAALSSWNESNHVCNWNGVACSKNKKHPKRVTSLDLSSLGLAGFISPSIANLTFLRNLTLENNGLHGTIPPEIGKLRRLHLLDLSGNSFHGLIPINLTYCSDLTILDFTSNTLSGKIPIEFGSLPKLGFHGLSNNSLTGSLPSSISNLSSLYHIALRTNQLEGSIPPEIGRLHSLQYFQVSGNKLSGKVPMKGIFNNATATSLQGNDELCGGIPEFHLSSCPSKAIERRTMSVLLKVVIAAASSILFCLLLLITIVYIYLRSKSRTKNSTLPSSEDQYLRVSYEELAKATDGFAYVNLIGTGSYGSVYKGTLDHGNTTVAVKVFKLEEEGASKSFIDECEALRNIRHRNLISITTSCSTVDSTGNDFKALVFEFMPNGNLETWLHSKLNGHNTSEIRSLSLVQRLNIAIDVADALDYLHHDCQTPTIHCDLKPSNILLDDDMVAHVGDFGLARLLPEMSKPLQAVGYSIGIRGTIGYVAPEYGAGGQVSTSGDVYSYGILLLEMFTGRRPVSEIFRDGHNLHKFVEMDFPGRVMTIIDPLLLLQQEEGEDFKKKETCLDSQARIQECIESIMRVGLQCSKESPKERMNMRSVATEMHRIRNVYTGAVLELLNNKSCKP